jgi:hypothetical protein
MKADQRVSKRTRGFNLIKVPRVVAILAALLLSASIKSKSVTRAVSGHTCDYIVKLVRKFVRRPIHAGRFGEAL